ncbi:MAG: helix-turn-helix transcriptional regulator, partial [Flavitalea sp.]
ELRVDMGISQETVYNETNIHVARIETATYNLSISTLSELMKFFDVKLSDFFIRVERSIGK